MTGASAPGLEEVARAKQALRERVWALLERERAAHFLGAKGRIPNFAGARRPPLAGLPAWRAASVVKANPDAPPALGPGPRERWLTSGNAHRKKVMSPSAAGAMEGSQ